MKIMETTKFMKVSNGWEKIYRETMDSYFGGSLNSFGIYYWLLLNKSHIDRKIWTGDKNIELLAGEVLTSVREITRFWRIHHRTLKNALDDLESKNLIKKKSTNPLIIFVKEADIRGHIYTPTPGTRGHIDTSLTRSCVNPDPVVHDIEYKTENEIKKKKDIKNLKKPFHGKNLENHAAKPHEAPSGILGNLKSVSKNNKKSPSLNGPNLNPNKLKDDSGILTPEKLFEAWNANCGTLSKARQLSAKRKKALKERIKEEPSFDYWLDVISKISTSDFCKGINNNSWQANFDFFIKPDSHIKAMEGLYDNRKPIVKKTYEERNAGFIIEDMF